MALESERSVTYDDNADSVGWIMKMNGGKVVDDCPGGQHRDYAKGGACHPPTFVVVSFDPKHRHPVEKCENKQEAGVDMKQEEGLLGHVTLGVDVGGGDPERHVDDVPLGGDDNLDHDHEEQRQELIDLNTNREQY